MNLQSDHAEEYRRTFGAYDISDLKTELARIMYSKNFEIDDLFYFDRSSDFHFYVMLYVYVFDSDGDKEVVCAYTLMLNEQLEVVDDFLS